MHESRIWLDFDCILIEFKHRLVVVEAAACQGLCVWEFEGNFRV